MRIFSFLSVLEASREEDELDRLTSSNLHNQLPYITIPAYTALLSAATFTLSLYTYLLHHRYQFTLYTITYPHSQHA